MKPPQVQLFLSVVLLDAIREDIQSNKKLNVQYYECLKRALFKPAAFFKGIVFPMLEVGWFIGYTHLPELNCPLPERLYSQGGRHHRFYRCQEESACLTFCSSSTPNSEHGLYRYNISLPYFRHCLFLSGPNSLFIRVLIDKKYQLPYKVVDALVFHFIRLSNTYKARGRGEVQNLPVLWHQSLLAFCQRSEHYISASAHHLN